MVLLRTGFSAGALAALLLCSGPALADAGKVIPLTPALKKELALLGDGVVGKALPAQPIADPRKLLNLGPGTWEFEIVSGKDKGKTQRETYKEVPAKAGGERWQRKIGEEYLEYIDLHPSQGWAKTAETRSLLFTWTLSPGSKPTDSWIPGSKLER